MQNSTLLGNFNFSFLLILTKLAFSQEDWALDNFSINAYDFPSIF